MCAHLMTRVAGTTMSNALLKSPDICDGCVSVNWPFICKLEVGRTCCCCWAACSSSAAATCPLPWHISTKQHSALYHADWRVTRSFPSAEGAQEFHALFPAREKPCQNPGIVAEKAMPCSLSSKCFLHDNANVNVLGSDS